MGNGRAHRVNGAGRRERVVTPALQLGVSVQVQKDPQGVTWVGLTFGQGTVSFTLAVPGDNIDQFLEMVSGSVRDAYAKHQAESSGVGDLLVPKSGLILPGDN